MGFTFKDLWVSDIYIIEALEHLSNSTESTIDVKETVDYITTYNCYLLRLLKEIV